MQDANNVLFQKISIPTPWMVTRNSEGVMGALKWQKNFYEKDEAKLEIPEEVGSFKPKPT